MVRDYKKKTERSNISGPHMKEALMNVFNKNMPLRAAARAQNIKRSTLQSRIKTILKSMTAEEFLQKHEDDGYDSETQKKGKYATRNIFSTEQEGMLESYIKQCSNMNYGLTYAQIRSLAFDYAKILPDCKYPLRWNEHQKAGKDWLLGFMKRHPGLSLRNPESTSLARGLGFNKTKVEEFFENFKKVLKKYEFSPDRIYNLDETGVTTVLFDESSSEDSEKNIDLDDTDDNESFESLQEDAEVSTNCYILVRFAVKTAFVYYVGNVVDKISDNKYNVKYLRRRGNSNKFYFPLIEDIATCELSDIHAKLTKYSKSRRDSTLTFYYNFEGIHVK